MKSKDDVDYRAIDQPTEPGRMEEGPDIVMEHDFEDPTSELTVTVVDAVASAVEISPTEVVPRVNDKVDPDALDRIFRPKPDGTPRQGRLTFELLDCLVTVVGDGAVLVYRQ